MKNVKFFVAVAFVAFFSACVPENMPEEESYDFNLNIIETAVEFVDWDARYDIEVVEWAELYSMPEGWAEWMVENRERFINAFKYSRGNDRHIRIGFWYYNGRIHYDPPWESEDEHMAALARLAELQYPGWDFDFVRGGEVPDVDLVMFANSDNSVCCGANHDTLRAHFETIFAHEFAHWFPLYHHYTSNETIGAGEQLAPGEVVCLMDRTDTQFGSPERFALGIPQDIDNEAEILEAVENIYERYPH